MTCARTLEIRRARQGPVRIYFYLMGGLLIASGKVFSKVLVCFQDTVTARSLKVVNSNSFVAPWYVVVQ